MVESRAKEAEAEDGGAVWVSALTLVDLAGSERLGKTGAASRETSVVQHSTSNFEGAEGRVQCIFVPQLQKCASMIEMRLNCRNNIGEGFRIVCPRSTTMLVPIILGSTFSIGCLTGLRHLLFHHFIIILSFYRMRAHHQLL